MKQKLQKPINFVDTNGKDVTISELQWPDELTAGHLCAMDSSKGEFESMLLVAAAATGEPIAVIKKLGIKDTKALLQKVSGFLEELAS